MNVKKWFSNFNGGGGVIFSLSPLDRRKGKSTCHDRKHFHAFYFIRNKGLKRERFKKKKKGGGAALPSMSGKYIIGMAESIAARQGTMGQLLLSGLPGKGQPIHRRLLLSFGSKWTTAGAAVGCVFSRYMALSITSHHWTPTSETDIEKLHAQLNILSNLATIWRCGGTKSGNRTTNDYFLSRKIQ